MQKGEVFAIATKDSMTVLDLRQCDVGMSCEEYSLLVVAGPCGKDMPQGVRDRMDAHEKACSYHQSSTWHQSALEAPINKVMENAAMEIVEKYNC